MNETGIATKSNVESVTEKTAQFMYGMDVKPRPFVITALIWWVLGTLFTKSVWFTGVWAVCLFDFLAIFKTLACVLALMSDAQADKKAVLLFQTLFWGLMKLGCLGLLGGLLMMSQRFGIPQNALLMGLATLIVVPLFGGFWWSQGAMKQVERVRSN